MKGNITTKRISYVPSDLLRQIKVQDIPMSLGIILALAAGAAAVNRNPMAMALLAAFFGLVGLIVVIRHPALIFWLLLVTSPFNDLLGIKMGSINLRPYNLLACAGLAWIIWGIFCRKSQRQLQIAKSTPFLFACLGVFVASKIMTVYFLSDMPPTMSKMFPAKYVIFAMFLFATSFVIMSFCTTPQRLKNALKYWLFIANIIAIWAIIQIVLSNAFGFDLVWHREIVPFGRPTSVFREPDVLGSFFGATILMALPLYISKISFVSRRYLFFTIILNSSLFPDSLTAYNDQLRGKFRLL